MLVVLCAVLAGMVAGAGRAHALTPIAINAEQDVVDITGNSEFLDARGDAIRVETAPGADGMTGQMAVRASAPGVNPNWIVFALRNTTERPIERWVTAQRYTLVGSGIVWPDLDARRIEAITPSLGFLPERIKSDRADIFKITIEPGQTITYVAELASDRFARIYVWKALEYELKARDRQLFNGILLGIAGVLCVFLTVIFAANHKPIFPSAALLIWCVLAYLCVDFGFWHKLFQLRAEDNAVYRAATEAAMAASLLIFLFIFLRLNASHGLARMLLGVWMVAQLTLIAVAAIDARLASTFARASFAAIGGVGMLATSYLALRGQDRALSLLPTWILFLVWVFAASVTLTGRMSGDIVVSGLAGGLVLITVLVGFTVTQFAFRSLDTMYGAAPSEQQLRSLAIDGSGAAVWEWNARREEIKTGALIEATLGLNAGELSSKVVEFCQHLHPADRERFRLLLWSTQERGGGEIRIEFRMLHADNSYRWFDLEAATVPSAERRVLRCVGLMRDVTDAKRSQERLLHDAVHDSLTGLPNRELFLDRVGVAVVRAKTEPAVVPTVMLIDMDKFKSVNASFGLIVGDSLLLTLTRRLQRHLGPQDTLARIGGNQFALMMLQHQDAGELAQLAERIRRSLRSPIKLAGQDIVLTGSFGIAIWDDKVATAEEFLKEAEVAMYRAKRGGPDRVEIFRAEFRSEIDDRVAIESDLRVAVEKKQLYVLYQPIISLATEELAGFEALVRWQHPRLGALNPADFIPVAEESDLIVKLGSYVLSQAVSDASEWQKLLPRSERPLFVSVNVSSRQLFRPDLIQEIRHIVGRALLPPGGLRLEVTESLIMENPEKAIEVLEWLRAAGAGLSIDDFGTGYSSLSYLQRFPFDTIKIDRDLVQSSGVDGTGSVIVRSIVALAHELGKKVVAEGVEVQSDVGFLRSIGCEYAQGFYYGEPVSQREVDRMLRVIRKNENRLQRTGLFRTKAKRKPERKPHATAGLGDNSVQPGAMAAGQADPQAARANRALRTRSRAVVGTQRGRAADGAGQAGPPVVPPMPMPPYAVPPPPAGFPPAMMLSPDQSIAAPPPLPFNPDAPPQPPPYVNGGYVNGTSHPMGSGFDPSAPAVQGVSEVPGRGYGTQRTAEAGGSPPVGETAALQGLAELLAATGASPQAVSNTSMNGHAEAPSGQPSGPAQHRPYRQASGSAPDLSTLPPAIAASLAKLSKAPVVPHKTDRDPNTT